MRKSNIFRRAFLQTPIANAVLEPYGNPCVPSPCGPNSICKEVGNVPSCTCMERFVGSPPNCRPECLLNSECPTSKACIQQKCQDPCLGACGINAICTVTRHTPMCTCTDGYVGDAFTACNPQLTPVYDITDACNPSPCGTNAICNEGSCSCVEGYQGDPYFGCRPECVLSTDCARNKACVKNKCVDPCANTCSLTAICEVINHVPMCSCPHGMTGNAFYGCEKIQVPVKTNPCLPSPCGPNSQCREVNGQAVCSCVAGYIGSPPLCRPECAVSSDCPLNLACSNQKCINPCKGSCGAEAMCQVVKHNPICSCPPKYTGDPFIRCTPFRPLLADAAPCTPSPCGPNSICKEVSGAPSCACSPNFFGSPPYCKPECISNSECPTNKACVNQKCQDACLNACGFNAQCKTISHSPMCFCEASHTGDPFTNCYLPMNVESERTSPCEPSPCGANAICKEQGTAGSCSCLSNYIGNPYEGCRPECTVNTDCTPDKTCIRNKCQDPCPGTCSFMATCSVVNHLPSCNCPPGYTGDPYRQCVIQKEEIKEPTPCVPNPCGPNSICRPVNGQSVCSCMPNYIGAPPGCRPECTSSSECTPDKACVNLKCVNPCPGHCGLNADCRVIAHSPICTCNPQHIGDPFTRCYLQVPNKVTQHRDPCVPNPCGDNAVCRNRNDSPVCSCLPNFEGAPPNCRAECAISQDCPSNKACINMKCIDPCPGSCGLNAECSVFNHLPACTCPQGLTGDPFTRCIVVEPIRDETPQDLCNPSPCGFNAQCNNGICTCIDEYFGDPYFGCKPECITSMECASDKVCSRNKCINPCPDMCASSAECNVFNHIPICSCPTGTTGNAFIECHRTEVIEVQPCNPNPCGPNSQCRAVNSQSICSCLPTYIGSPPSCRPECTLSSECPSNQACNNHKCINPCLGTCGYDARCEVINHNPVCSCPPQYTGDPFTHCTSIVSAPLPPLDPCTPSPCGPHSICKVIGEAPSCTCMTKFMGAPPNCHPECISNSECPSNLVCVNQECKDPCPGSCGYNADCAIVSHGLVCTCPYGQTGDPLISCNPIRDSDIEYNSPCEPSPCGLNAECMERNGAGACKCLDTYIGNPYEGCRPECVLNTDCSPTLACMQNKCKDPCPGVCAPNGICQVVNHVPSCYCPPGLDGDPYTYCRQKVEDVKVTPCTPSPCGPNSQCREINSQAICSCLESYIGSPPSCRPECTINSECLSDKACINQKCVDPCRDQCGRNAKCRVISHNPICSCQEQFTGDPFSYCMPVALSEPQREPSRNPCYPSPCGPNSQCQEYNQNVRCTCLPNYIGTPPRCRPECTVSSECNAVSACINNKCKDPCPGACGINAQCNVNKHLPICSCLPGYTGDPFSQCSIQLSEPDIVNLCSPTPCGANALCNNGQCSCLPEYFGDPYIGCKPECVLNIDCDRNKACVNNKCVDPCLGTCGNNATCEVINHIPACSCPSGTKGDPFHYCSIVREMDTPINLCSPSPCGPYSQCREINGHAVCVCVQGYTGSPPNCRPECTLSSDCGLNQACSNQKCIDPCPGACGQYSNCKVINHNPVCTCLPGFSGDPFTVCQPIRAAPPVKVNPCLPSPCGPNSQCIEIGDDANCKCLPDYIGAPPACRPECTSNTECSTNMACINRKCLNPCESACGINAECRVVSHTPICICQNGYSGDPFIQCSIQSEPTIIEQLTPCLPSPCGSNAECRESNNVGSCVCISGYYGDPYVSCKPECLINSDCPSNQACKQNKCIDPCPGTCGINAQCYVTSHIPNCVCPEQYLGDPYKICSFRPQTELSEPCSPSPCGPNSKCNSRDNIAVCTCLAGYQGSPPNCKPECVSNAECSLDKVCDNHKCLSPCPRGCGVNSDCRVINHNPICSCKQGYSGDPFSFCFELKVEPVLSSPLDPCLSSPCGPNAECRNLGGIPSCSCKVGFIASPPNCRPECIINTDCNSNEACLNMKCQNPCLGSCGLQAICNVVNHVPVCLCPQGYKGDPFTLCTVQLEEQLQHLDPCNPSPCGPNAVCNNGECTCLAEYHGDPYFGCRPECVLSTDCSNDKTCLRQKCVDPCRDMCGVNADCNVYNHVAVCSCPIGMTGDAFTQCLSIEKPPTKPCESSPCGPNSICRELNGQALCACIQGYIGNPPNCRPECIQSTDCHPSLACINMKCQDPCPGSCASNAECRVINHNPVCTCPARYTGSPFTHCYVQQQEEEVQNPCHPSPCGENSLCTPTPSGEAKCSCQPTFEGTPPNCRRECRTSDECPANKACVNYKCMDPCIGSCGSNSLCIVRLHTAMCSCQEGYTGDPFLSCYQLQQTPEVIDPCYPSPCGANSECKISPSGVAACTCHKDYFGNPYEGCRPECVINADCPYNKACLKNKCQDPCPGVCGSTAICQVINHLPSCSCSPGYTGNPYAFCHIIIKEEPVPNDPCIPNPCGSNTVCKNNNGLVSCSCLPEYFGTPPNCRPECSVNSECSSTKSCIRQKCVDPCQNVCGQNAECRVVNHAPICSCRRGYEGDPFIRCSTITNTPLIEANPCTPSPCGPNSLCQMQNRVPVCSCISNYIGSPPNCRPECTINSDCPSNKACINQRCNDPCIGSCGLQTICNVHQHSAVCSCLEGYTGDPFASCYFQEAIEPLPEKYDRCNPNPCGANARCDNGACSCLPNYFGNPYMSCRPECTVNSDCATDLVCVNTKCVNPCANLCGQGAICEVYNHIAMCSCSRNTTGNAFVACTSVSIIEDNRDPCIPSPCGPNSVCRTINKQSMCSCLVGYIGTPPSCRPECVVDSDCAPMLSCSNQKCVDPCRGSCGINAECKVHNHKPICYCRNGLTGDPFIQCSFVQNEPTEHTTPCEPSPCGPNTICKEISGTSACSCINGYTGRPPYCRPECVSNSDCNFDKSCINKKCVDPCSGACGRNADCRVVSHSPQCSCQQGYTGDPFNECVLSVISQKPLEHPKPCTPNPCGPNAICQERYNSASCVCISDYFGNPYEGCRPECLLNSDCSQNLACINNKCTDPCPGFCGINAVCQTVNHVPKCSCITGHIGNPYDTCIVREAEPIDPCSPSPCGPHSVCLARNNKAMCSCLPDYTGYPPNCKPECVMSSECPLNKACVKQKCIDPCINTCGENAECRTHHHSPYCTCLSGFEGDPFVRCVREKPVPTHDPTPCEPNPCGQYAICRDVGGSAVCVCKPGYMGTPPSCAPECTINQDCPNDKACVREKCMDPCLGSCGSNSQCRAVNHLAICMCVDGYRGDPFVGCYAVIKDSVSLTPVDPCVRSPCGINAECHNATCSCIAGYHGNPYEECRPECTINQDCLKNQACINYKCINPCNNACGLEAVCNVYNHMAICDCPSPLQGDPFIACRRVIDHVVSDPCTPNPCGPNSICRADGTVAHCSCRPPMYDEPPTCRPECRSHSDCAQNQACRNKKCQDPCPGACGTHAICHTSSHSPICSCPIRYTGDPFIRCIPVIQSEAKVPSPCRDCGPNADCIQESCRCRDNYIGEPPNCRPECLSAGDCDWRLTCVNKRCIDPCPGACGYNALCTPAAHEPRCVCPPNTYGNPLTECRPVENIPDVPNDPCNPSPCGPGAICRARGSGASCECEPGLRGDPYSNCRPECLADSDCSPARACIRSKCRDPCEGTCGVGADCETVNHIPLCSCPTGTRGNAFERCDIVITAPPCTPSPCGPGALCSVVNNNAVCSCPSGTSGDASSVGCRPECVVSSECPRDRACVRNKCIDPCLGACGNGAMCRVFDHAPICSCPPSTTGDPFYNCVTRDVPTTSPTVFDPCDPNPCGPHGTCRDGFCSYPECVVNDDCPGDRACMNRKCSDPCVDSCGVNAICTGVRHSAICSCPAGYTGYPFVKCERITISTPPQPLPECTRDQECADNMACVDTRCVPVCTQNSCGLYAQCIARQHRAHCACLQGFEGDAYTGCYSVQCHSNNDCPDDESCDSGACIKVCSRIRCGAGAKCIARGHIASCECNLGARGNPWVECRTEECAIDNDCPSWLACRGNVCKDPCPGSCAENAQCSVVRHVPVCECLRGTNGNPKINCQPVLEEIECSNDAECGPNLACLQGRCKNPCDSTSCGVRAECRVANTLPFRTLVCECPKPLSGDASVQCNPKGECSEDNDCGEEERCLQGRCALACDSQLCGAGAECRAVAHRASCSCVPPLQGDPNVACTPGVDGSMCLSDAECGAAEACVSRRCVSACAGACGAGALCEPDRHRARCRCPPGTAGDPARACYTPECTVDENCPFDKSCMNGYCQDPCALETPCGRNAVCDVIAHAATCRCPAGTQGDPRRACVAAACQYNEDCDITKACDRLNRVCQPVCSEYACAPGATCTPSAHRAICTCPPDRSGDPYLRGCVTVENTDECSVDSDCPAPFACVNSRCIDLCRDNPCESGLLCKTVDILPLRAVACVCADGGRVAPDTGCRAPPQGECSSDNECANSQICRRGNCVDACKAAPCGQNALCEAIDHVARCSCPPGYLGNPRIECNTEPRQPAKWECYSDKECGEDRACVERVCVNPCVGACGPAALCRVLKRQPVCSCPIGYTGDALIRCTPPSQDSVVPVGCKANSDCPLSQACINNACANPCACGTNAECTVVRHHPVCFCQNGFSGNPYTDCIKVSCTADRDCPDSDICYNGACINPCIVESPCAISAECYGKSHRSNCRCPLGTHGNPLSRCHASECEVESDCNDDSVCVRGVCQNACSVAGLNPCASNAECFAKNHAASCKCPSTLPLGDPLTQCERVPPVIGQPECQMDGDCPSGQACLRDVCRDACAELTPCTGNSRCSVSDSIPFRTLICRCPEGYVPNVKGACDPLQLPPLSCSSDTDCSDQESCVNRICRNPCNCGDNAECFIKNHRPVCSCRDGYDGNPYSSCRIVGCRTNTECPSDEACVNGNCVSPCLLNNTCGFNAECYVERNHPLCRCRTGFEGDAYTNCSPIECRSNGDCPRDKLCRGHKCINPCLSDNNCGRNAICLVRNHLPVCKCEFGYNGSPYIECKPEITTECTVDADCPSKMACLSAKCVNPCTALRPCATPAQCEVLATLPVRTMLCSCPPGYVSGGGGVCRPATTINDVTCEIDNDCTSNHACVTSFCKNPCDCGPNTDCQIRDHKPVCACRPGFLGDPHTGCYSVTCRADSQCSDDESCINNQCVPACSAEPDLCGDSAECYGEQHRAFCRCQIGTTGNPNLACTPISCRANSDCPSEKSCVNNKCVEPCTVSACNEPAECRVHLHEVYCVCPPGYQSTKGGCNKTQELCTSDIECPQGTACLNSKCVDPCVEIEPCGRNTKCLVTDTNPVRTMICECEQGYKGNALLECTPYKPPITKCIDGQGVNEFGECEPCIETDGKIVDARGRCVCDVERGFTSKGDTCVPIGCRVDEQCDEDAKCMNGKCVPVCEAEPCGLFATCTGVSHRSRCTCITGYVGNPKVACNATTPNITYRTDFPLPDMQVHCLADGVQVSLKIKDFNGVLYVKGYSKDERCRLIVHTAENQESPVDFTVHFGDCGLVHVNGLASFVLVMQKHPKLVTSNAKAFHIKCIYQTGEQNVTLAFNVSMLTTAGTIANTGPPPTCSMRIVSRTGDEVSSAEIGENLVLQVDVQPSSIYGGFARSCVAKTSEVATNIENEYTVTDADGCATDAAIFGEWERSEDGTALRAAFNAFKFPSSDNIRFQCNIRVCFGKCQPVNCRGNDAFGKRKKRDVIDDNALSGRLREEVTVESNQILTLERRDPSRAARQRDASDGPTGNAAAEVCVSAAGLAVALALTALLALVAVAAAVACWLVAWRRARPPPAPLPHPPDFPNPLFQR